MKPTVVSSLAVAIRAAGIPIDGVALLDPVAHTVRIDFQAAATSQQRTNAASIAAAFDWSDAAEDTRREAIEPLLKALRDAADQGIADIDTYLAIADSATNVQVRAEVKAIDQRQRKIIQALKRIIQRTWR